MFQIVVKVAPKDAKKNEALAIPRLYCSDTKSYLIIEGLTTLGLELIDWLITRGARHFVIASILEADNGYKNLRLRLWQSYGVKVILRNRIDLSQKQNIKALLKEALSFGPIDAIFDLRRTDLTSDKNSLLMNDLNLTTKILDQESRCVCPELRLFVVGSAVLNAGSLSSKQKSQQYDINNSEQRIVEDIIEKRKKDGLHGLLIRWGLIETAQNHANTLDGNITLPAISKYVLKLDELLGTEESVVEVSAYTPVGNKVNIYYLKQYYNVEPRYILTNKFIFQLNLQNT